jgi:hypothetical protein
MQTNGPESKAWPARKIPVAAVLFARSRIGVILPPIDIGRQPVRQKSRSAVSIQHPASLDYPCVVHAINDPGEEYLMMNSVEKFA